MGGGGAQCCSGRRLRLDIAAPIVSRSRPKLLCGLAASQPYPAAPRPAAASETGACVCGCRLLMDDGLQHHTLHRDLSLLVLDALQPLGNGRVLPAGPLREPFARTLGRSDAVCAVAPYADGTGARVAAPPSEAALRDVLGLPQHQHAEGGLGLGFRLGVGLGFGLACRHTSTLRPPAQSAAARRAQLCRGGHAWLRVALGAAEERRGRSGLGLG